MLRGRLDRQSLTIGLLGDVMLGRGVADALRRDPSVSPWSPELVALARTCDVLICNLECCLSERGEPTRLIPGKPFFFRGPPWATKALHEIGVTAAGLANNHALDFGELALEDTLAALEAAGIAAIGAGLGPVRARHGVTIHSGDTRLGVVAVADHPASYAAKPGAHGTAYAHFRENGLPGWLVDELARLRLECDHVIAFTHWGPNMTTEPADWQRERAFDLLRAGADIVVGHSAHVFHGVERSSAGLTLFDLGDALDDYAVNPRLRNDLGLFALWRPGGAPELELAGLRLHMAYTELASGDDEEWIDRRLRTASQALGTTVEQIAQGRWAVL